jgi:hypothetical protein
VGYHSVVVEGATRGTPTRADRPPTPDRRPPSYRDARSMVGERRLRASQDGRGRPNVTRMPLRPQALPATSTQPPKLKVRAVASVAETALRPIAGGAQVDLATCPLSGRKPSLIVARCTPISGRIGEISQSRHNSPETKTPPERGFPSAPGEIRTPDLRFRRPTLYPAELRALS